jgi:hypothetical protein
LSFSSSKNSQLWSTTLPQQVPAKPCVVNFGTKMCNVFAQKITVDALDNKLDDSVFKGFYFSIF